MVGGYLVRERLLHFQQALDLGGGGAAGTNRIKPARLLVLAEVPEGLDDGRRVRPAVVLLEAANEGVLVLALGTLRVGREEVGLRRDLAVLLLVHLTGEDKILARPRRVGGDGRGGDLCSHCLFLSVAYKFYFTLERKRCQTLFRSFIALASAFSTFLKER